MAAIRETFPGFRQGYFSEVRVDCHCAKFLRKWIENKGGDALESIVIFVILGVIHPGVLGFFSWGVCGFDKLFNR
jgi:hypothetical protein